MLLLYRLLINLILLISPLILIFRIIKKKENFLRFKEKFGFFSQKRKKGKLVWFHGASVGELHSVIPLIEKLNQWNYIDQILITSNTLSSSKIMENIKLKKVSHQFFPIDNNQIIKKFLQKWKPSIAIFIDSEIWPNTIINLKEKKIPIFLLNARLTKKSFKRWLRIKKFANLIFKKLDLCLCSNKETIQYLKKLGAKNIKYYGNLKYSQSEIKEDKLNSKLINFISKKKVWCASSTHNLEEQFAGIIHKKLKIKYKNLLTVIIPRHIDREMEIESQLNQMGLKIHKHESNKKLSNETDIYLVNSYGKTKSFYSKIKNVYLGGSLISHGGQNPLEAARYNCNILHGPNVYNFKEIYGFLAKHKISSKITNINQAINSLDKLFSIKNNKKNIKNKIKTIGYKILNKNLNEIKIVLKKV